MLCPSANVEQRSRTVSEIPTFVQRRNLTLNICAPSAFAAEVCEVTSTLLCELIPDEPHAETLLITNTRRGRDLYQKGETLVVELVNSNTCDVLSELFRDDLLLCEAKHTEKACWWVWDYRPAARS